MIGPRSPLPTCPPSARRRPNADRPRRPCAGADRDADGCVPPCTRSSPAHDALLPSGTSPVVVLDLSWSTSSDYKRIGQTIADLASSGRRIGLVVFSDVPYEMFPPGTPARELRPLLRFFAGPKSRRSGSPWASSLSGGTRISAALLLARDALRRDGVSNGSAVLVSDLGDSPNDRTALAAAVVTYVREGIPLRSSASTRPPRTPASSQACSGAGRSSPGRTAARRAGRRRPRTTSRSACSPPPRPSCCSP